TAGQSTQRPAPFAFAHDQIRDVLYWNLSQIRRRLLHQAVAEAIVAQSGDRDPTQFAALAMHFGAGEDLGQAARFSILAGRRAAELHAFEEAVRHFTEAGDMLESRIDAASTDDAEWREFFALLGDREHALDILGERERQRLDLRRMEEVAARLDDAARLTTALRWARFD